MVTYLICFILFLIISLLIIEAFLPKGTLLKKISILFFLSLLINSFIFVYGQQLKNTFNTDYTYVQTWNTFHYYIGAKYSDELGYFNLYSCTLLADNESQNFFSTTVNVRNLYSYEIVKKENLPLCPKENFTLERWEAFKNDITFMQREFPNPYQNKSELWNSILSDKGYNPSPLWTLIGSFIANNISLQNSLGLKIIFNLDFILVLLAILYIGKLFDTKTSILMTLFMTLSFGSYGLLLGNFLQYLWLFFIILGVCFWKEKKQLASAFCFSFAIMTRVFPMFLLAGLFVKFVECPIYIYVIIGSLQHNL